MSDERFEDAITAVLGWMLDESDDIEGTRLNLGDGAGVWLHTQGQVREWLRERLPAAITHAYATPERPQEATTASESDEQVEVAESPVDDAAGAQMRKMQRRINEISARLAEITGRPDEGHIR